MEYTQSEKQYAMFIHLSLLTGGILPLVLWLIKKDTSAFIDANGKIVVNWIISSIIYAVFFTILSFLVIGIPLLIALAGCNVIFAIIGAIRADDGILWPYPLCFTFLK